MKDKIIQLVTGSHGDATEVDYTLFGLSESGKVYYTHDHKTWKEALESPELEKEEK